jgi:hypothetical protein
MEYSGIFSIKYKQSKRCVVLHSFPQKIVFAIVMTFPIPINFKTLLNHSKTLPNCFEKLKKKTAQRIAKTLKNVPKTF